LTASYLEKPRIIGKLTEAPWSSTGALYVRQYRTLLLRSCQIVLPMIYTCTHWLNLTKIYVFEGQQGHNLSEWFQIYLPFCSCKNSKNEFFACLVFIIITYKFFGADFDLKYHRKLCSL
jgi:hypothetical protein